MGAQLRVYRRRIKSVQSTKKITKAMELIASSRTVEQIRDYVGLDSLKYLSLEGMLASMPLPKKEFCTCCFTGEYPVPIKEKISKHALERKRQ